MSDGTFPDRIGQLEARWRADPSSRIFLQLAEEHRHQGRVREALAVLDKGLREHPGYLSALVAKGRCHLELGEGAPAREALERVVKQDPTQMVANKLLVRAYLETGQPARARERLDLYSLLNDNDPEIEDLRRQIKVMERPKEQPPEDSPFELGPAATPRPTPPPAPAPAPAGPPPAADDIFDLGLGAAAPRREVADVFPLEEAAPAPAPPSTLPGPTPAAAEETEPGPLLDAEDDGDLFPQVSAASLRRHYLASLGSEGIFDLGEPLLAAAAPAQPAAVEELFDLAPEPAAAPPQPFEPQPFEPEPVELEPVEPEPVAAAPAASAVPALQPEPAPEPELPEPELPELKAAPEPAPAPVRRPEPEATATLGELYYRQGHLDEAERIFLEVLEREPGSAAARSGLERTRERLAAVAVPPLPETPPAQPAPQAAPLDARGLLAGFRPGPGGGGTTARKIFLLNRYLDRIRGGRAHVS